MSRLRWLRHGLVLAWLGLAAVAPAQDGRLAPPPEELEARAERFRAGRRTGAWLLWGGMGVATVIITVVRVRQRRRRPR